jgi:hypothetical protein
MTTDPEKTEQMQRFARDLQDAFTLHHRVYPEGTRTVLTAVLRVEDVALVLALLEQQRLTEILATRASTRQTACGSHEQGHELVASAAFEPAPAPTGGTP